MLWKLDCNIHLGVKQLLQVLSTVSLKIKSQLLFSLKILTKKNRDFLQQQYFIVVTIGKVLNNFAFICKKYYISKILTKVGLFKSKYKTHSKASHSVKEIIQANTNYFKKFKLNITELDKLLPIMYWLPKMHKTAIGPRRFVALKNWSTKLLSDTLSKVFKMILVL